VAIPLDSFEIELRLSGGLESAEIGLEVRHCFGSLPTLDASSAPLVAAIELNCDNPDVLGDFNSEV